VRLALEKNEAKRRSRKTSASVRSLFETLTQREQEVMELVPAGLLKVHRGNAMRKMKANSIADLLRMADMLGIRRTGT
jgi:FixJ family two-component response regulator